MSTRSLVLSIFLLTIGCEGGEDSGEALRDSVLDEDSDTDHGAFSAPQVEIIIAGADGLNPNGDGSGVVTVQAATNEAVNYTFDLGDGTIVADASGEVEHTYTHEGTQTYILAVTAEAEDGAQATWTGSVTVRRSTSHHPRLVWADEFDGDGAVDSEKWHHQVFAPSDGRWFNGELQHYTDRVENSFQSDGTLKIVARKESYTTQGVTLDYTSARLNSRFIFTYGRVDVRAKLPVAGGTWPAIWTLGANINEPGNAFGDTYGSVSWPACGEIDIMEQTGGDKASTLAYFHWGNTETSAYETEGSAISNPDSTDEFHIYSLVWDEAAMRIYVDDQLVHELANTVTRPYDNPHYLLLNIAMGGNLGGAVPGDFTDATLEIDYVRVYQ
ncbi:MAG: family 16 glycosylhydrolase [Myxococcota bacterium]